jgi:Flp pilus assembly pilin Flp
MQMEMIKRFVREDDGMEMVEWAIVGVVFALAAALFWGQLGTAVDTALGRIETCVATSTCV